MTGRTRLAQKSVKLRPIPDAGSHPRCTENMMTSISPNQKVGIAVITRVKNIVMLSITEYCRTADITPTITPTITANIIETLARTTVLASLPIINFVMGCPFL